jgi:hypothetical protein
MEARAKELARPLAWYVAQFVGHVIQYSGEFKALADRFASRIGFKGECVGVHVRQTDKINEARLFELRDYMRYVENYYGRHPGKAKCVYLITDEVKILREATEK